MLVQEFGISDVKEMLKPSGLLEFNREIEPSHVRNMMISLDECGIKRLPVIGNVEKFDERRKHVIVDGQHLLSAFVKWGPMNNQSKILCIVDEYEDKSALIHDVAKLNNTQRSWTDVNYLHAWYKYGRDNLDYYANYHELYQLYNFQFDGMPIGFMVDLFAKSKDEFREGRLEFRDKEWSIKILQIAYKLKMDHGKPAHTLHGLRMWAAERVFQRGKEIDFIKLEARIMEAIRHNEDKTCNGRDDFKELVERVYTRL